MGRTINIPAAFVEVLDTRQGVADTTKQRKSRWNLRGKGNPQHVYEAACRLCSRTEKTIYDFGFDNAALEALRSLAKDAELNRTPNFDSDERRQQINRIFFEPPRVHKLDAWIEKRRETISRNFEGKSTVASRKLHLPLKTQIGLAEPVDKPTLADYRACFAGHRQHCIFIEGDGGAGKTSLAFQLARWALAGELTDHAMVPVVIDYDFDESDLATEVQTQLGFLTDPTPAPKREEVLDLLSHGRILVIIDHYSEMSDTTRAIVRRDQNQALSIIVTARRPEIVTTKIQRLPGRDPTVIKPHLLEADDLWNFVGEYFEQRAGALPIKDTHKELALRRIRELFAGRKTTPLFAKLYLDGQIKAMADQRDVEPPSSLPELSEQYLSWLEHGDQAGEGVIADQRVVKLAKQLAWKCVGPSFTPGYISQDEAVKLANEAPAALTRLKDKMLVLVEAGADRLRFNLDPLAEYLAALHLVAEFGDSEDKWNEFLNDTAPSQPSPQSAPFFKALLDCYESCREERGLPAKPPQRLFELAQVSEKDRERLEESRVLIENLGFLQANSKEIRRQAVITLDQRSPVVWRENHGQISTMLRASRRKVAEVLQDREAPVGVRLGAASVLTKAGDVDRVAAVLQEDTPDPTARNCVVVRYGDAEGSSQLLKEQLAVATTPGARQAILLAMGGINDQAFAASEFPQMLELFRNDPDPGIHSATDWVIRQWLRPDCLETQHQDEFRSAVESLPVGRPEGDRRWLVTEGGGQELYRDTMVVLDAGSFTMGSPEGEKDRYSDEVLHQRAINRRFAISSRPVTTSQFNELAKFHGYDSQRRGSPDAPANGLTYYDAVAYCNWLSEMEGIPRDQWCYELNEEGRYAEGMRISDDVLKRLGYRLPTEAEWEYACRAGTLTPYSFGFGGELLAFYGWFLENANRSRHPVASLRPNPFGLFDMHGNVWEWCLSGEDSYENAGGRDEASGESIGEGIRRVLRGGGFGNDAGDCRSAVRNFVGPASRLILTGVRVARTYP